MLGQVIHIQVAVQMVKTIADPVIMFRGLQICEVPLLAGKHSTKDFS